MLVLSDDVDNTDFPIVNLLLILANVMVFLLLLTDSACAGRLFMQWGTVPCRFAGHQDLGNFTAILTSMFLHGGWLHLIGNMWVLHLFGDNVEDRMGHFTYLMFYICCGVFADLVHIFSDPYSIIPAVGASGAIAGVMGAYIVLHPKATCKTWWGDDSLFFAFRTYRVPAWIIIGGWFALQVVCCGFAGHSGIAFFAHVGGFLAGIALLCFVKYRAYEAATDGPVSYGGALPAVSLSVLMVLSWWLISPHLKHEGTVTAVAPLHAAHAAQARPLPHAHKPAASVTKHKHRPAHKPAHRQTKGI